MSELEAAGDAMTGALAGRVIGSGHGEGDGHNTETACLNCRAPLAGPYCAQCGQQAHVHRTLTALWHDIAHGVFHFEGKAWRTLPMLAWRPGEVTRRYIRGERARFVSPLALFLFSVFLMFAVFETVGAPVAVNKGGAGAGMPSAAVGVELARARTEVARLERERRAAVARGAPTAAIDSALADARIEVRVLMAADGLPTGGRRNDFGEVFKIDTGSKAFDDRVRTAIGDPELLLYKLQTSAYKFAWALIPISLPFMWAMFAWRREYRVYDHAVFVTYSLSFVVLLLVVMALIAAIGGPSELLLFLIPVHFYRQLKQAYRLTRGGALWRTMVLLAATSLVLLVFGVLLLALGLSG